MKMKKIISLLLAVLMLASAGTLIVSAAESAENAEEYTYRTGDGVSLMKHNPLTPLEPYAYKTGEYALADGGVGIIETPEDKLSTMDYRYGNANFQLYVDAYSGEVAVKNRKTGELLFTNPYNIGKSNADGKSTRQGDGTKNELLSQLIVSFTDITDKEEAKITYNSYYWATCRNQITVKSIKNGIRVEYSIGREVSESPVPHAIFKDAAEAKIFSVIEEAINWSSVPMDPYTGDPAFGMISDDAYRETLFEYSKLRAFYDLLDPNTEIVSQVDIDAFAQLGVDLYQTPVYRLAIDDPAEGEQKIRRLEAFMKLYAPDFTVDEKNAEYAALGGYEEEKIEAALFRMALEYTLDEDGLVVSLPSNGIRFDETKYRLNEIQVLPYMGAGMNPNYGYTFFPDGSGALFDFQTIAALGEKAFSGKIYGEDYAYHEIEGKLMEIVRYPVFGLVERQPFTYNKYDDFGNISEQIPYNEMRGFVAIVEEGASLMQLTSSHGGLTSEYNTIKMSVIPRPTDSFNLQDSVAVAENKPFTVVSDRKYTGSYKIRYKMLTDDNLALQNGVEDYYECSYIGMAKAYREYLESIGVLTRLTENDVKENLPLYIETFGAFTVTKKILSIPVEVVSPLTSFKDIATMYDSLATDGITNINFVMKGYRKGGLTNETVPYQLNWDRAVEREMDFEELLAYAREKGFGVFPDFDFVFSNTNKSFDGYSLSKHAAKTIDNRYTSKREYSATRHTYSGFFELALSSASFSHFYEKFIPKYAEYDPTGISLSTLGSYLNSDFDEDDPYNRADTEGFTVDAFAYVRENLPNTKILTSGGNAYSWKYVDHITDIALDSSRIDFATASVPFLGMVLHGYKEIAGTPFNTEGNLEYAFLKTLESGAALKFLLSYQNTAALKEYENTSKYYSIRYDIWYNDMVANYNELNSLLKDTQTSVIVDHQFLDGVRLPDNDEMTGDILTDLEAALKYEEAKKFAIAEAKREKIFEARKFIVEAVAYIMDQGDSLLITHTPAELAAGIAPTLKDTFNVNKSELLAVTQRSEGFEFSDIRSLWQKTVSQQYTSVAYQMIYMAKYMEYLYDSIETRMKFLEAEKDFDRTYYNALVEMIEDAAFQEQCDKIFGRNGYAGVELDMEGESTALFQTILDSNNWVGKNDREKNKERDKFNKPQYQIDANYEPIFDSSEGETSTDSTYVPAPSFGSNAGRYDATPYTIVYQEYENGTSFLMNFNDYRVIVEFNGRTYTIEGYGYIVLGRAA